MRRDLKNRRPLHRQEKQKGERRRSSQARVGLDACIGFRPGMRKVTPHGRRPISSGVSGYHKVRVCGSRQTTGAGENIFSVFRAAAGTLSIVEIALRCAASLGSVQNDGWTNGRRIVYTDE